MPNPAPELVQLIEEYKQATRQFVELPSPNAELLSAGAATCQACHAAVHQDWQATRHARALQTLAERSQQFNPECLAGHTLGFRQANGFYSVTHPQSEAMGGWPVTVGNP